ncbi:hypothetical protein ACNKHN_08395 [Shigella flexneri]
MPAGKVVELRRASIKTSLDIIAGVDHQHRINKPMFTGPSAVARGTVDRCSWRATPVDGKTAILTAITSYRT